MIEIEKPRIETEELTEDGKYGKFVVEPLERGFGNTSATVCAVCCFPLLKAVLLHQSRLTAFFTNFQLFPA
mgnify:CR=1 FL=1